MKYSIFFLLILFCISVPAQTVDQPKVDQRIELLSIVFRLAGAPEYNGESYKDYTAAIHRHFDPYRDHKAVVTARKLHELGAGYSYVAALAVHIRDIRQPKLAAPMIESDARAFGGAKNIDAFLTELGDFYHAARFEEFWAENRERYERAERNFTRLSKDLHPEWFSNFYGVRSGARFKIVIGMGNGNNFYGPSVNYTDGSRDIYAVFAPLIEDGEPKLPDNALSFTVHEFNHAFANPFIDKHAKQLAPSAKPLFAKVKPEMSAKAYKTWEIMMYESLVRSATAAYLLKHNPGLISGLRASDMYEQKFLWVDAFTDLLRTYEANRGAYPDLDSFLPKIAAFFNEVAKSDIRKYQNEFDNRSAHVLSIGPFANGSIDVDPGTSELRILFDKPLNGIGISVNTSPQKNEQFPEIVGGRKGISFANGNREFVMNIKLRPHTEYGFVMSGRSFQTPDGYPLKDHKISFKTK